MKKEHKKSYGGKKMPEAGFEPATFRLWVERSDQAELPRQAQHWFNKAIELKYIQYIIYSYSNCHSNLQDTYESESFPCFKGYSLVSMRINFARKAVYIALIRHFHQQIA